MIAEPASESPTGVNTPIETVEETLDAQKVIRQHEDSLISQYRVGETQTTDWYEKRIHILVDEIYRLTHLLNVHNIPHKKPRT